ncbi:MAG: type II secretion system GspH family protein [Oscillospiraceae bacterium]|jgi:prepilin-type N-terminal cleavage/methylation domain-containing protein|nr:type II secretion system GspH family protein [Oscillospiraceae bacterium]
MKTRRGFTLAELLIAIMVIAVIAPVLLRAFSSSANASQKARLREKAAITAQNLVEQIKIDGVYQVISRFENDIADDDYGFDVLSHNGAKILYDGVDADGARYDFSVDLEFENYTATVTFDSEYKFTDLTDRGRKYDYAELNARLNVGKFSATTTTAETASETSSDIETYDTNADVPISTTPSTEQPSTEPFSSESTLSETETTTAGLLPHNPKIYHIKLILTDKKTDKSTVFETSCFDDSNNMFEPSETATSSVVE